MQLQMQMSGPPFTLGLGSFQLFWRRVLRGTAYLLGNCSVVVGVRTQALMSPGSSARPRTAGSPQPKGQGSA